MCLLIYLFGDARQLYPYELARPSFESLDSSLHDEKTALASPGSPISPVSPWTAGADMTKVPISPASSIKKGDLEAGPDHPDIYVSPSFPPPVAKRTIAPSEASATDLIAPFGVSDEIPQNPLNSGTAMHFVNNSFENINRSWKQSFNIRNLARSRKPTAATYVPIKATPMFGSLTGVESPIITRAQWEIAARAMGYSLFITLTLGAAILAIPSRRHH